MPGKNVDAGNRFKHLKKRQPSTGRTPTEKSNAQNYARQHGTSTPVSARPSAPTATYTPPALGGRSTGSGTVPRAKTPKRKAANPLPSSAKTRKARKSVLHDKATAKALEDLYKKYAPGVGPDQAVAIAKSAKLKPSGDVKSIDLGGKQIPVIGKATPRQIANQTVTGDRNKTKGLQPAKGGNAVTTEKAREGIAKTDAKREHLKGSLKKSAKRVKAVRKNLKGNPQQMLQKQGLDPDQAKVLSTVLNVGKRKGANRKQQLSAVETALVESNIANLSGGDADSQGWRQERTSIYGTGAKGPQNVKASAKRYFDETVSDANKGKGMTAGQLAQATQGSAFPARYDEAVNQAKPLLKAFESASSGTPAQRQQARTVIAKASKTVEKAKSLGIKIPSDLLNATAQPDKSKAPPKKVGQVMAMVAGMNKLEKEALPYVWGGGHVSGKIKPKQIGGLDCSGTVSYVLQQAGLMKGSLVSGDFGSVTEPGPGMVTVFYNPTHVFMRIGNKYFGTSSADNPGGGPGYMTKATAESQINTGEFNVGHVPGFGGKLAKEMGTNVSAKQFPGMSYNAGSNTAAITGASTVRNTPGFTANPIKPTSNPKQRQTRRQEVSEKLSELGYNLKSSGIKKAGTPQTGVATGPKGVQSLAELEKKYGG